MRAHSILLLLPLSVLLGCGAATHGVETASGIMPQQEEGAVTVAFVPDISPILFDSAESAAGVKPVVEGSVLIPLTDNLGVGGGLWTGISTVSYLGAIFMGSAFQSGEIPVVADIGVRLTGVIASSGGQGSSSGIALAVSGWGYAGDIVPDIDRRVRMGLTAAGVRAMLVGSLRLTMPTDSTAGSELSLRAGIDRASGEATRYTYQGDTLVSKETRALGVTSLRGGIAYRTTISPTRRYVWQPRDSTIPPIVSITRGSDLLLSLDIMQLPHPVDGGSVIGLGAGLSVIFR